LVTILHDSSLSQIQRNSPASHVTENRGVVLKSKYVNGHYKLSHCGFGGYLNLIFGLRLIGLLDPQDLPIMPSFFFVLAQKKGKTENKSNEISFLLCRVKQCIGLRFERSSILQDYDTTVASMQACAVFKAFHQQEESENGDLGQ
jgi:hypothetical protein